MKKVVTPFSLCRLQCCAVGVVSLLVAMVVLAVAAPSARANDGGFEQVGPTISGLEEKTDVTVTDTGVSYKLGNAAVDGGASTTLTIGVSSGWFTISDWKVEGVEPTVALSDKEKLLTAWRWRPNTLKNERYRHIEFSVKKNSGKTMSAQAIQQFLHGMTFWVPSGDLQTVWVSATYKQLLSYRIAPYDQPESYNAHLFNGHAYSFVTSFDEDSDTGYSEARKTFFLGKSGYLMTIESKGERNAVSHVLSEGPGWIGGTNATEQPGVIGGTSTTNAIRGYYVEFDGFDPRLAGQVMTTSATIGSENYDSHTESSESTNPAEADTKPDKSGASDVSDAKPDTKTDPSESDTKPDKLGASAASDADPNKPANSAKQHTAKLSLANTGLSTLVLVLTALSLLAAALITAALRHCSNE